MIIEDKAVHSSKEIKEFFEGWELYRNVIAYNYMAHEEMFQQLELTFSKEDRHISILDLGCGDATITSRALQGKSIRRYCGIDLSGMALTYARKNFENINCEKEFVEGDFIEVIKGLHTKYDYVIVGYSLHHLFNDKKEEFFKITKNLLSDNGTILVYDSIRKNDEDRDTYLEKLFKICRGQWKKLSDHERNMICEHVQNNDYPETEHYYESMAKKYSFPRYELKFRNDNQLYGFWLYSKRQK